MTKELIPAPRETIKDFDFLNKKYFNNELPPLDIYISDNVDEGFGSTKYEGKTGIPLYIVLSPLALDLSEKYYASVLLHEMAHVASLLKILGNSEKLKEYKNYGGHTPEWWSIISKLNEKENSEGESLFHIVPIITDEIFEEYTSDSDYMDDDIEYSL